MTEKEMNNKVEELMEWVSRKILEYDGRKPGVRYGTIAREILSHPDLALIDRRNYNAFNKHEVPRGAELAMIVPLAEALKEANNG